MKKLVYILILLCSFSTKNLFPLSEGQMDTIGKFVKTDPSTWDKLTAEKYLIQTQKALPKAGRSVRGILRRFEKKLLAGIATVKTTSLDAKKSPSKPRTTRDVGTQTDPWLPEVVQTQPAVIQAQPVITPIQPKISEVPAEGKKKPSAPTQPLPSLIIADEAEAHAAALELLTNEKMSDPKQEIRDGLTYNLDMEDVD